MKLIVLHGSGLVGISNYLVNLKKNSVNLGVLEIDAKSVSLSSLVSTISTPQLFSTERLIILENLDESSDLKSLPDDLNLTVLIRLNKELKATSLLWKSAQLKKAQFVQFNEEKETPIFPFLDLVIEGSLKSEMMLNKLLAEYGSQYVLTMLFYALRRLIVNPNTKSSFVLKKLQIQKQKFPLEKINFYYREILITDFKIKSGILDEKTALHALLGRFVN